MPRFEKGQLTAARIELTREAARMRAEGATMREIAAALGCSRSYASELVSDPDGSKGKARKDSYRGVCETCGASTNGSYGPGRAPKRCGSCVAEITAAHGTRSRYSRGCSCDECRRANREYMRSLQGQPPRKHGTPSAYRNYGCRCDDCREANRVYGWMHPEYRKRWAAKKKAEKAAAA